LKKLLARIIGVWTPIILVCGLVLCCAADLVAYFLRDRCQELFD
jgi:hypothetical protein